VRFNTFDRQLTELIANTDFLFDTPNAAAWATARRHLDSLKYFTHRGRVVAGDEEIALANPTTTMFSKIFALTEIDDGDKLLESCRTDKSVSILGMPSQYLVFRREMDRTPVSL
jgi:hypothetical protein